MHLGKACKDWPHNFLKAPRELLCLRSVRPKGILSDGRKGDRYQKSHDRLRKGAALKKACQYLPHMLQKYCPESRMYLGKACKDCRHNLLKAPGELLCSRSVRPKGILSDGRKEDRYQKSHARLRKGAALKKACQNLPHILQKYCPESPMYLGKACKDWPHNLLKAPGELLCLRSVRPKGILSDGRKED